MDIKMFKEAFPFICEECREFAHTGADYCEKCGAQAVRRAINGDYNNTEDLISERKKSEKLSSAKKEMIKAQNQLTKVGYSISLIGSIFLIGFGGFYFICISPIVYALLYGISFMVIGGIGIIGIVSGYYGGVIGARTYLVLGWFFGIMTILLPFYFGFQVYIIGLLLIFIGSRITNVGWRKDISS